MSWSGVKKQISVDIKIIEAWCEGMCIENYTINNKGEIDVDGGVYLTYKLGSLEALPYKFGRVSGDFNMSYNRNIKSLKNCPDYIGDSFLCSYCPKLESLEGCPKVIKCLFICEECGKKFTKQYVKSLCHIINKNIFV